MSVDRLNYALRRAGYTLRFILSGLGHSAMRNCGSGTTGHIMPLRKSAPLVQADGIIVLRRLGTVRTKASCMCSQPSVNGGTKRSASVSLTKKAIHYLMEEGLSPPEIASLDPEVYFHHGRKICELYNMLRGNAEW